MSYITLVNTNWGATIRPYSSSIDIEKEQAKKMTYGTLVNMNWGATIRPYSSSVDKQNIRQKIKSKRYYMAH